MINIASLIQRNRSGETIGIPCFCTANEQVLRAIIQYSAERDLPTIIEATCNQVNQDGGYTGLSAIDFANWVATLAAEYGASPNNIILGGDHLGPNPWRHLSAEQAMEKAEVLIRDYVEAGFQKIHIDTSMACSGEPLPSFELVAERAARLCQVAEKYATNPEKLIYIIGTEVPIPGGETEELDELAVTTTARFQETIDTHRVAFERYGLMDAWTRIVSIVTQPGVDFSHTSVHRFKPFDAIALSEAITAVPGMTFEAHSTDYQPTDALKELVAKHFFFLKVGPELTFRAREALFALSYIENQIVTRDPSNLVGVIDEAMDEDSSNWTPYYRGDADTVRQLRHFSYSDRIRYYWTVPKVKEALKKLTSNLEMEPIPATIVSQYFSMREFDDSATSPQQLISNQIYRCIERYYRACGH